METSSSHVLFVAAKQELAQLKSMKNCGHQKYVSSSINYGKTVTPLVNVLRTNYSCCKYQWPKILSYFIRCQWPENFRCDIFNFHKFIQKLGVEMVDPNVSKMTTKTKHLSVERNVVLEVVFCLVLVSHIQRTNFHDILKCHSSIIWELIDW